MAAVALAQVARAGTPEPYNLSARAARGVSVVVQFLDAYNSRDLPRALAQFTDDPRFVRYVAANDCDYRRVKVVRFFGRSEIETWLRQRFADRDRLAMDRIRLLGGHRGAALGYARRTSDTLRALGFADGIQAGLGTKVAFTTRGPLRIAVFGNAGNDEGCRPAPGPGRPPSLPALTARQAEEVSVVVRFVDAFNGRNLRIALGLFGGPAVVSDCDYKRVRAVRFSGRRGVERWLRQRFSDRDRLTLGRVFNENRETPTGVAGVEYGRRTSNTLRALGYRTGIVPPGATKVVFTSGQPARIAYFANGPVGAPRELCRPTRP